MKSPTHGLSLFYTDFDRSRIAVHEIEKMGRKAVDSNELFIEDFEIPRARIALAKRAGASNTSCTA